MKPRITAAALAVMAALSCSHWVAPSRYTRLVQAEATGPAVDDHDCLPCHGDQGDALAQTAHRNVLGCQTCHGPGQQHVTDPPGHIVRAESLLGLPTADQSEMCLACHGRMAMAWPGSDHATAPLPCFACHADTVHFRPAAAVKPAVAFRKQQAFCGQCHALDTLGFTQIFHHPVPETAMECTACHDVHGKMDRTLAMGRDGACGRCHRRQVEPRVFQHEAMSDGCLACHQAHGSPLRALLTEPGNTLCLKCHLQADFPIIEGVDHTALLARGALCYDCHVEVHGSNTDPSLLGRLR